MNKYLAIGNLTQDPVCKDVGQSKVCTFGIAVNEYFYKNQEKQKTTLFLDVETWSKQAENCVKFLEKGKKVAIEGKLKINSWEKNGQKFNKIYCVADKVHFLGTEEGAIANPKKVTNEIKEQEKVENEVDDIEDIDDIPF
jgi:single-strand DNA-binding protein